MRTFLKLAAAGVWVFSNWAVAVQAEKSDAPAPRQVPRVVVDADHTKPVTPPTKASAAFERKAPWAAMYYASGSRGAGVLPAAMETEAIPEPVVAQEHANALAPPSPLGDSQDPDFYHAQDNDDAYCGEGITCAPAQCGGLAYYAGIEATMLQPRFGSNAALTVMESNGSSFEDFADREFDYDLELSPRAFVGLEYSDGIGFRATWWQFDHEANDVSVSPPANGFGSVSPPPFGDVDISTSIPTDALTATSALDAYTVDFELTKTGSFAAWDFGMTCGLRYASLEQSYMAETANSGGDPLGRINFDHALKGMGPTVSIEGALPVSRQIDFFGKGRGSLLFGDGNSRFVAGEDLDLSTPFTTTQTSSRDDLLPIAELQLGLRWHGQQRSGRSWRPFATAALESQFWSDAGSATSESGDLGFFGFSGGVGIVR